MSTSILCPHCQFSQSVDFLSTGESVTCANCGQHFAPAFALESPPVATQSAPADIQGHRPARYMNLLAMLIIGAIAIGITLGVSSKEDPENLPGGPQHRPGQNAKYRLVNSDGTIDLDKVGYRIPPAIEAQLEGVKDATSLPLLIKLLSQPQEKVRTRVCDIIKKFPPTPAAVPPLLKLLTDRSHSVRESAIEGLGVHGMDSDEVIPALGKVLQTNIDMLIVQRACDSLKQLATRDRKRAEAVADALTASLDHIDPINIRTVVPVYETLGSAAEPAAPKLVKLLKYNYGVKFIVGVLAQCGKFDVLDSYVKDQGFMSILYHEGIAFGIGRMRPCTPAAIALLERLYESASPRVRLAVLISLNCCEPRLPEAISLLQRAQKDRHPELRDAAATVMTSYQTGLSK